MTEAPAFAGRFAPTPSGPLHAGSLVAALASRCQALSTGGRWMLRIDDIDPPRERPGAAASILRTLERFGFAWDGAVRYQSARLDRYRDALARLGADERLYRCRCTRRELRGQPRYPGTCRENRPVARDELFVVERPLQRPATALRVRLDVGVPPEDAVQGRRSGAGSAARSAARSAVCEDVVVRRRDGLVAYALACAVDDADVSEVVRGADLLDASVAQHAILGLLGSPLPARAHVPVALDADGRKLGKSRGSPSLDERAPLPTLLAVWRFLGQPEMAIDSLDAFWREAPRHWSLAAVPPVLALPMTGELGQKYAI